jgi:hypothetical protein
VEKVEELQECSSMGEKQEESMFRVLFFERNGTWHTRKFGKWE